MKFIPNKFILRTYFSKERRASRRASRKKTTSLPLLLLFLASCSSSLTYPPLPSDLSIKEAPNKKQELLFKKALLQKERNPLKACETFLELSHDQSFPMAQLSRINSFKLCPPFSFQEKTLWPGSLKEINPAFRKKFLENAMDLAQKRKDWAPYTRFGVQYTDSIDTKERKEKHLLLLKKQLPQEEKDLIKKVNDKLYDISPRLLPHPSAQDEFLIARDYSKVRQFQKAREHYFSFFSNAENPLLKRIKAYEKYAFTFKLQRNKRTYTYKLSTLVTWLEKKIKKNISSDIREKYWNLKLSLARAYWTIGIDSEAKKTLRQISDAHKEAPPEMRARSYLIQGLMKLEKKESLHAEKLFSRGLEENEISEDTLENLSWNLGWNHYINNNFLKAEKIFSQAQKRSDSVPFKRKLLFWQGKAKEKLGKKEEAHKDWDELMSQNTFDYYGIVSALERKKTLPPIESKYSLEKSYTPLRSHFPTLDWIVHFKMWDLAKEFMKDLQRKYTSPSEIEEILPLYHFSKWYDGGIFKFYKIHKEKRKDFIPQHILAAFPTPYKEEFLKAEAEFKIPASFLMAVARQESSFNKNARSWADAFGILQVTPEKAKQFSQRYNIPYKNYEDLYNPSLNIRLATALYKDLLTKGRGTFISSVAAYNAGKKPVNSWYRKRMRKDPLEFIEMIPYKETRNYLKLVFRNTITYQRLLGKSASPHRDLLNKKL